VILGIAWAVVGYVLAEVTQRGKLATTVITAVAGALGLGAGVLRGTHATVPGFIAGLGVIIAVLVTAGLGAVVVLTARTNQQGKPLFMASIRQAHDPEDPEDRRIKARRNRRYW
jgi:ABC-type proline/glycine betaine transport system permease subunit